VLRVTLVLVAVQVTPVHLEMQAIRETTARLEMVVRLVVRVTPAIPVRLVMLALEVAVAVDVGLVDTS